MGLFAMVRRFLNARAEVDDALWKLGWHEGRLVMLAGRIRELGGIPPPLNLSARGERMLASMSEPKAD